MRIHCLFLLILVICFSCEEKKQDVAFLERKIPIKQKIKWLLKKENASVLKLDETGVRFLRKFYTKNKCKNLWVRDSVYSSQGKQVERLLRHALAFGIPQDRLCLDAWDKKHPVINELLITHALALMHEDLKNGILDTAAKALRPLSYPDLHQFNHAIKFKENEREIVEQIISWGPQDTLYRFLAQKLYVFATSKPLNDQKLEIPLQKKDSVKSVESAKKALFQKGYLKTENVDSLTFYTTFMKFQEDNGLKTDGVIGQFSIDALQETNLEKCQRTALVLEKLRWRQEKPKRYICINIPEYLLRFYADDTLKAVHKVVVGKPDKQSPEFSAEIRTIVVYPYWSVPFSITSEEILPDAKRNAGYFAKNHMKLYKKDEEIDPYSVNWKGIREKTFPYKAIQQPGPHNSLGIIKFEFSNKFGVYVHDTPSKGLFNTVVRSYSHGCIRCQNPVDLAKMVLIKDENSNIPDSLDSILGRELNQRIQLKKRLPIFIEYRSVVLDREQNLIFLRDIYKRDERLAKLMFQKKK